MAIREAGRHAKSKDPVFACATKGDARSFHYDLNLPSPLLDKSGGPHKNRPPQKSSRASLGRTGESPVPTHSPKSLLPGDHRHRSGGRHHWTLGIAGRGVHANHLSRLGRRQTYAPGQQINALGIA